MSLIQYFKSNGKNGFGYGSTAERVTEEISLKGKNILLTGCNSGLGKETLRVLSLRGARIIGTARTLEKAASAINEVGSKTDFPLACDLTDPKSIKVCVDTIKKGGKKLDAIICNAGIMALPKLEQAFGYELQF
ncbi:MAG: SDR family NAD(P)-dependent oxidoreductase, partial [Spirochaetia bacterium]|nr:SDR family NAD(P)-dependent oxidoreductase [Spirochaetia bacterium]